MRAGVFGVATFAAGFAAATVHGHEATAEEGLVKELGEPGASAPLGIGQVASMPHGNHFLSLSDISIYIRY